MTFDEAEKWIADPRGTGPELSRLYSRVNLKIMPSRVFSYPFKVVQNQALDKTFTSHEEVKAAVKYGLTSCIGTEDDLSDFILNGHAFYWLATRKRILQNGLVEHVEGTICARNPFCGCSNLVEALIKADLLGDESILGFSFVLMPMWEDS